MSVRDRAERYRAHPAPQHSRRRAIAGTPVTSAVAGALFSVDAPSYVHSAACGTAVAENVDDPMRTACEGMA